MGKQKARSRASTSSNIWTTIGVAVVAVAAVVGVVLLQSGQSPSGPSGQTGQTGQALPDVGQVVVPSTASDSSIGAKGLAWGPDTAKVKLVEYLDYQ